MLDRDIAILILRVVGLLFIGHGTQKLFGWFGGHGLAGTAQWLGSLGLQPARFWAVVAGLAELLGGIGLALGLFTPIAAAAIIAVMLMAIIRVHWANGLWVSKGGMEYPLVNILVSAFIGLTGAGRYALDTALNNHLPHAADLLGRAGGGRGGRDHRAGQRSMGCPTPGAGRLSASPFNGTIYPLI